MRKSEVGHHNLDAWMHNAALTIALLWAGWWTFFGLASGISEGIGVVGTLIHTAVPGLIFLASVTIAWRWTPIGAVLLLMEGAAVVVLYPLMVFVQYGLSAIIFVLLTMALPPILAGLLLLASWWRTRTPGIPHNVITGIFAL